MIGKRYNYEGLGRVFDARGGSGFFCGNREKFPNCLDEERGDKNEESLINSKE